MAQEKFFLEKFRDPDTDYHTLQAANMYGVDYAAVTKEMRGDAKSFNFGIPYGMGFASLAILLYGRADDYTIEQAKIKYEMYFKDQPKVRQFFQDIKELAQINGYTKTIFERRRYYKFTDKEGNPSNKAKAQALRQAGNAVIQGSAADIFKLAVCRLFNFIKEYDLFDAFYIVNMIHDECLMEIDTSKLNARVMLKHITDRMQFQLEGYPPLFIGAGFGMSWKDAKGGHAEIHPNLSTQIARSVISEEEDRKVAQLKKSTIAEDRQQAWRLEYNKLTDTQGKDTPEKVLEDFEQLNYEFRKNKIANYLLDENNFGKIIHPVIGSLINGHFDYGIKETDENKDIILGLRIDKFAEEFGLNIDSRDYLLNAHDAAVVEEEEEDGYDDDEEEDLEEFEISDNAFALIDESDSMYGIRLEDIIAEFGLLVAKDKKILGIDARHLRHGQINKVTEYLDEIQVGDAEVNRDEVLQVVLLGSGNKLIYLDLYVRNVDGSKLSTILKLNENLFVK